MPGRPLGDAFIVISPDTRLFGTMTEAQVRKAISGINPNVRIGADTKGATRAILDFQARLKALSDALGKMRLDVKDDKAGAARITSLQGKVLALAKSMSSMTMRADTGKLDAQVSAKLAQVKDLRLQLSSLKADADTTAAAAKIASLQLQEARLDKSLKTMKGVLNVADAEARLASVRAQLKLLASNARAVKLAADNSSLLKAISVARGELAGLQKQAADVRLGANVDPAKLIAAESTLLGYEAALEKLVPAVQTGDVALGALGKAITGTGTGWGFLTRNITLFGGAFNRVLPVVLASVAVWHVLADAIIEIAAVWIPASLAVGAFAIAASDAAKEIVNRMNTVHTVMDATGRSVAPMTNAMENLHKAVQPQVYQLFGDALTVMNSRAGTFSQVAKATGTVLDQLGARIVAAVTPTRQLGAGTQQLSGFWQTAVTDVSKLGDSIGNLFGIFGNFFKAIPGFAAGLLTIGDDFTKVLETASAAAVPLLKWVLLLHGFILYTGLAVTATLAFIGGVANLAKQFVTFAAGSVVAGIDAIKSFVGLMKTGALFVYDFVTAVAALIAEEGILVATQELLAAVNPFVWVAAAVVALGALVFWMNTSKDAAQSFNDSLQKTITNASLASLQSTLQQAAAQTATRLAGANQDLNKALAQQGPAVTGAATRWSSNYSPAVDHAARSVLELTAGQRQIADQAALVSGRVDSLSKRYGSNTAALGALVAAGITSAQITDKNKDKWAQALIQVNSTTQAYQAMGTQAGVLGNDLDVLGRTATDQYKAIQTLNQGWAAFIADVTGSQGSFDTVAQGFFTLADHSSKLNFSLGKLKVSYADANVAIDSLTPAGIALNQAFGDQVVNVDKLFASWRTAGLAGNLFTAGVKDAIAPLTKYANGSQEATAQLVALAQEAGYQGPISMAALTKWLGNTHNATQNLKDITNQATEQEALLTGAMQDQGSYIANNLLRDINNAILKYNGVEAAATAYGNAVAKSGTQSDAAQSARKRLIADLINSGNAAHDTTGQIAAMITKVLGIPAKEALQIVMQGTGSYTVHGALIGAGGQSIPQPGLHPHAAAGGYLNMAGRLMRAAGGYIDMGSGPVADDVPIMASKGEYVIKAASVAKYGKGAMDAINSGAFADGGLIGRYASGGLIRTGSLNVLSGQYAADSAQAFQQSIINTEAAAMKAAITAGKAADTAAQAAAAAIGGGGGVAGPGGGAPAANAALARRMMPAWGSGAEWAAWNTLMMHESGWNQFARNPSSGAYGIPQALPPGKMGAAANPPQSNPAAQISWMIGYIRSAYGDPIRAWAQYYAHPGGVGYYAGGGLVGNLAAAQAAERSGYSGLGHAFAAGPKKYLTKTVQGELGTLAKRQASELAAYKAVVTGSLTKSELSHLGATARAEIRTAGDQGLNKLPGGHPGFARDLRAGLARLDALSKLPVPKGITGGGGSTGGGSGDGLTALQTERQGQTYLNAWRSKRGGGYGAAWGPVVLNEQIPRMAAAEHSAQILSKASGLTAAQRKHYLAVATADTLKLAVLKKELAIERTWRGQLGATDAQLARQVAAAGNDPSLAKNVKAWKAQEKAHEYTIGQISKMLGYSDAYVKAHPPLPPPPVLPPVTHTYGGDVANNIGAFLASVAPFALGGKVRSYDKGGLWPSGTLGWNGSGHTETVTPGGGGMTVTFEVAPSGSAFDAFLTTWLKKNVKVKGGGNVQKAWGAH